MDAKGAGQDIYPTVTELLHTNATMTPDKAFIHSVDQGSDITHAEVERVCHRFAHFFRDRGLKANDRVAILADNSMENCLAYLGVLRYGATAIVVNVEMNQVHIDEILAAVQPRVVFYEEGLGLPVGQGAAKAEWIALGEWRRDRVAGVYAELAGLPDTPDVAAVNGPHDHAVILYTSGTASRPKGVVRTFLDHYYLRDATVDMLSLTRDDRVLEYRPFSWSSARNLGLMTPMTIGATLIMPRKFSRSRFVSWIRDYQATMSSGTPTVLNMLLNRPVDLDPADLASLRFMTCSSAPLAPEQWRRFEEMYGIKLLACYGMSEGGWLAGNRIDRRKMGTVGPVCKYQDLRIVDADGSALPADEEGEIEIGGPQLAWGYLLSDGKLEPRAADRLRTGDLGVIDADGFLSVTGRVKDLIIRGGVNIAPNEIDAVLQLHPGVAEGATVGVPDAIYGEEVICFVSPKDGVALTKEAVLEHCRAHLPQAKMPKDVVFVSAIAKNDRGKISRPALLEEWKQMHQPA